MVPLPWRDWWWCPAANMSKKPAASGRTTISRSPVRANFRANHHELDLLPNGKSRNLKFGFGRARSAELFSDTPKDFVRESSILHGASQNDSADLRGCLKDR